MFCMKCGQQLPDDARFCSRCRAATKANYNHTQTEVIDNTDKTITCEHNEAQPIASEGYSGCTDITVRLDEAEPPVSSPESVEDAAVNDSVAKGQDLCRCSNTASESSNKSETKKKKAVVALFICVYVTFAIGAFLLYFFNTPAYKAVNAIKKHDCAEVEQHLDKTDSWLQQTILSCILPSSLDDFNKEYNLGEITESEITETYDTVLSYDLTADYTEQYEEYKRLVSSKQAYEEANTAKKKSDYQTAILNYRKVVPEDALYDVSQSNLQETIELYKTSVSKSFYNYVLNDKSSEAQAVINEALKIVSDGTFEKMKNNLISGLYYRLMPLVKNSGWQSYKSQGVTYVCWSISISKDPRIIRCYYVPEWMLALTGGTGSITCPVSYFSYSGGEVCELSYHEYKDIPSSSYTHSNWNTKMTKAEKLEALAKALD